MTKDDLYNKYPKLLPKVVELSVGKGWYPLLDDLCAEVVAAAPSAVLEQCKEKFGGLRFYVSWSTEERHVQDIIHRYEDKSMSVCETCGKPGVLRKGGWVQTACNACAKSDPFGRSYFDDTDEKHICPGWNTCPECSEKSCTRDSLSCYDCETWRHFSCAKKHADTTGHKGQINDLVYITKAML